MLLNKATTSIKEFNEYFNSEIYTELFDTLGGLVTHKMGRIPRKGDFIDINGFNFFVVNSDGRKIHTLKAIRINAVSNIEEQAAA